MASTGDENDNPKETLTHEIQYCMATKSGICSSDLWLVAVLLLCPRGVNQQWVVADYLDALLFCARLPSSLALGMGVTALAAILATPAGSTLRTSSGLTRKVRAAIALTTVAVVADDGSGRTKRTWVAGTQFAWAFMPMRVKTMVWTATPAS